MSEVLHFQPNRKVLNVRRAFALVFSILPSLFVAVPLLINSAQWSTIVAAVVGTYVVLAGLRILFLTIHFDTIRYELSELALTNAAGRFWKVRRTTPLEKVTNVDVRQGPIDRWIGVGNVWVFTPSTGALTPEAMLVGIDQPYEIRARILALAEKARGVPAAALSPVGLPGAAGPAVSEDVLAEMLRTLQRIESLVRDGAKRQP
jgi:membrane protein YdbS with pleckstrin-like domain